MSALSERTKPHLECVVQPGEGLQVSPGLKCDPDCCRDAAGGTARAERDGPHVCRCAGLDVWMGDIVVAKGNTECCSECRLGPDKSGLSITRTICFRQ